MSTSYVKARRAHSMPSRYGYVLPSAEMGEYEVGGPSRRRSAPARPSNGGLFPLKEEGAYGALPAPPPPPKAPFPTRERKPKVYSSYSVDSGCSVHKKSLVKSEQDLGTENIPRRRKPSWSSSSVRSRRTVSASPSRASSERPLSRNSSERPSSRTSNSPEPVIRRKLSAGRPSYTSTTAKAPTRTSTVPPVPSNSQRYSTSNYSYRFQNLRNSSFEENEEYEYEANERKMSNNLYNDNLIRKPPISSTLRSNNFSKFSRDLDKKFSEISLDAMRKPKVNSWDSMGILGLSSKMWNDTKNRQDNFTKNTGSFLREENYSSSYIM